jgi:hypothetical protein
MGIIFINSINQLVFEIKKCCVSFAVGTKSLNEISDSHGGEYEVLEPSGM